MSSDESTDDDAQSGDYGAGEIDVLEGLEHVRKRPAMYIGTTDDRGFHHLVYEVVDNSIDEALVGHCDEISVGINKNGSVTISDDGRGIPVDEHEEYEASGVEVIMTVLHAGGKFDSNSYEISGGLHGVGVSVVNALSEWLEVTVKRDGAEWHQRFERGHPVKDLERLRDLDPDEETGTEITFSPDKDIFGDNQSFDADTLSTRLRELAFLNSGVRIQISDEREESDFEEATFEYDGGIREYVEFLNETRDPLHDDVIYVEGTDGDLIVEVAIQTTNDVQESIHSFANNINTREGGKHLTGFKTALTRVVNKYAEDNGLLSDLEGNLKGTDVREGMTAVISLQHPDPQFEGQTKTKLGNDDARSVTETTVYQELQTYFNQNPDVAQRIVLKAVEAAQARKEAKKAEELARRKDNLSSTNLPGKLSDCQSRDPSVSELFIVEGDSAGGSAKQARNRENQAVLPIKGKILNVEKHRLDRILENDEIKSLIQAIGTGIGDEFDIEDARYENIIIMTDADADGAHIRTLLLTFFFRYMKPLIENGYVYSAQPPLYRIKYRGNTYDVMSDEERDRIVEEKCNGNPSQVQRFKGLGEMNPNQLWDTTMHPEKRILRRISVEDAAAVDKMCSTLMGSSVAPRRELIQEYAGTAEFIDI